MSVWTDFPCRQMRVPLGNVDTNVPNGNATEVIAEIHGPFALHAALPQASHEDYDGQRYTMVLKDEAWVVAHELTGYAIAHVDSLARARWLAETILALGLDWSFADPAAPRGWPPEAHEAVKKAIVDARALEAAALP